MAESVASAHAGAIGEPAVPAGVSGSDARVDPNAVYSLGSSSGESERLQRQADQLAAMNNALLDRVGVGPGDCAIDVGCGPRGIIELLHQRVSPGGRVVGLDSDPAHVAMAFDMIEKLGLGDVQVIEADARRTGYPLTHSILCTLGRC